MFYDTELDDLVYAGYKWVLGKCEDFGESSSHALLFILLYEPLLQLECARRSERIVYTFTLVHAHVNTQSQEAHFR